MDLEIVHNLGVLAEKKESVYPDVLVISSDLNQMLKYDEMWSFSAWCLISQSPISSSRTVGK